MTVPHNTAPCPPWCETADHAQRELTHRADAEVTCSMHPIPAGLDAPSHDRWDRVHVALLAPPTLAEPFIELTGHHHDDTSRAAGRAATRLTLAEAQALADALGELLEKAEQPGPGRPFPCACGVTIPVEGREAFVEKHITECPVQRGAGPTAAGR